MTTQDAGAAANRARPRWSELLVLAIIVIGAMAATLPGVGATVSTSAPWIVRDVLHWLRDTSLKVTFVPYPTLFANCLTAIVAASQALGAAVGWWTPLEVYTRLADYRLFLPYAGYLSMAFGVVGIVATWQLGRRLGGPAWGLGAAALLAFTPTFNRYCHEGVPDCATTALSALALLFLLAMVRQPTRRNYVLTGLFIGLAIAAKYSAAVLAVVAALAHLYLWRKRRVKLLGADLWLAAFVGGVAFAITSFQVLLQPKPFLHSVLIYERDYKMLAFSSGVSAETFVPYLSHLEAIYRAEGGIALLFLAGLIWVVFRRTPARALLAGTFLITFLYVGRWRMVISRFYLAAYPALAALAADAVLGGIQKLRTRPGLGRRLAVVGIAIAALALFAHSVYKDVAFGVQLGRPDTTALARQWIETNLPRGAVIAGPITPERFPRLLSVRELDNYAQHGDLIPAPLRPQVAATLAQWPAYDLRPLLFNDAELRWPADWPEAVRKRLGRSIYARRTARTYASFERLRGEGVQYIVTSSSWAALYSEYSSAAELPRYDPRRIQYDDIKRFYDRLDRVAQGATDPELKLAKSFEPVVGQTRGDTIRIYRVLHPAPKPAAGAEAQAVEPDE